MSRPVFTNPVRLDVKPATRRFAFLHFGLAIRCTRCRLFVHVPASRWPTTRTQSPYSLSRHSASHGRLGKKRTTGPDGFDEFLTLRRGRRTAHNAGVMMVSRSYARDCTSERHRRSSGDAIRRVLRLFGSRLRSGGSRLPYSPACGRGLRRRGAGSSYMAETRMGDCQAKKVAGATKRLDLQPGQRSFRCATSPTSLDRASIEQRQN